MKKAFKIFMALGLLSFSCASAREGAKENDPLFAENKGQLTDQNNKLRPDILYYGSSDGLSYYFKSNGISYQLYKKDEKGQSRVSRIDLSWIGANKDAKMFAANLNSYREHFYTSGGNITDIKHYSDLQYKHIYEGIDLHYYYKNESLKYDFILTPDADYKRIQIRVEGASKLELNKDGTLSIITPDGSVTEGMPLAFQGTQKVKVSWVVKDNILSFQPEDYDHSLPLVIDPQVYQWSRSNGMLSGLWNYYQSFMSGVNDTYGNTYVAGTFNGNSLASQLVKYDDTGGLVWIRALQSPSYYVNLTGISINGNYIYACGNLSQNISIATAGAYQTVLSGGNDCFLVKYDTSGTKIWGTLYGGSANDSAFSCKVDASDNIFMCGTTLSSGNMSSPGAYQTVLGGNTDAFIAKFDASGHRIWGSYFGGSSADVANSIDVNNNRIFIAGYTNSATGIASVGAQQTSLSGNINGFLLCMDTSGAFQWGTYYGGDSTRAENCVVSGGALYLAGTTKATTNIATSGAFQTANAGGFDGFLAKFDLNGLRQWGTYYGGTGRESAKGNAVHNGNVYFCGNTTSSSGIATPWNHNSTYVTIDPTIGVAYWAEFDTSGQKISGSYFNSGTTAEFCSVGIDGALTVGGSFYYYSAYDYIAFLNRYSYCNDAAPLLTATASTICSNSTAELTTPVVAGATYRWYRNDTLIAGAVGNSYIASIGGSYRVWINECPSSVSSAITLTVVPAPVTQITQTNVPCYGAPVGSITVTASGGTLPYHYAWDNLSDTTAAVNGLAPGTYVVHTSDSNSCVQADTITIAQDTTIAPSDPLASICAVTVDSATGKNLVIWEKVGDVKAIAYNIYRETSVSGQYNLIGTNQVSQFSTFLDTGANPLQQSYSYKLAEVDSCSHEWPMSDFHKTIHLNANVGVNGEINLIWNAYEGKPYSTHSIERSFNGGPFTLLNEVSSTITSYSDLTPPTGVKVYRIALDLSTSCSPSRPTSIQHIVSNTVSFGTTGINDNHLTNTIRIVPNPTSGIVSILNDVPALINLYDATGKLLLTEKNVSKLDIGRFAKGTYLIRLLDKEGNTYYSQKILLK